MLSFLREHTSEQVTLDQYRDYKKSDFKFYYENPVLLQWSQYNQIQNPCVSKYLKKISTVLISRREAT